MKSPAAITLLCAAVALTSCGARSNLNGSSSESDPDPNSDPGTGTGRGAGASSGSSAGTGAGSGSSAGTGSVPDPDPGPDPTPDPGPDPTPDPGLPSNPNCAPGKAKSGASCTASCVTTCGFNDLGTRSCDCVSDVFVACHCPRPTGYQGKTTAPPCDSPDQLTHYLDNTPCFEEWAQCIGSDAISGTNPRGCACLVDPVNGALEWTCGSTNKWFLPE